MNLMTSSRAPERASTNPTHSPAGLALSLVGDVRSLGLVSQSDQALQNYAKRLLACVRSIDDAVVIDAYSGHEFLNLISRLNQEVAPYLQQQAQPAATRGPIHLWLIDQADQLSGEQQSIIFRLIELFPALPFRVIWLSSQPLQAWKDHAKTECVFLDLDAIDQPEDLAPVDLPDPLDTAAPEPQAQPAPDAETSSGFQWPASALRQKLNRAAALVGLAVLASLAWMSASSPNPSAPESSTAPAPATAASPAPDAASEASAPITATATADATVPVSAPAHTQKALHEVARTGGRWLQALPTDTLVVEHGAFNSVEQAQKFQAKHKALDTARIVAVRKTANTEALQFSVITGPFRSEDRAKTYVSRLDWRAGTRIRATDSLKALLAPAS